MENKDFVHWHCHSEMSAFDGLAKLSAMVMQARKMGFPAIALTDHGNIMGWIQFLKEARMTKDKKDNPIPYPTIKAILGSEFYLSRKQDIGQYDPVSQKRGLPKKNQPDGRKGNRHLNLYAMNFDGYKNLCTLSQKSWTDGFYSDPRIDMDLLSKHSKGVMCGSACLSSIINVNILYGKYDKARNICGLFKEIFNDNFFLEVMYHGIQEEKVILPDIFKLSSELNIPVCATNDVHYLLKEQAMSQEVLLCMSTSRCIKDEKHISFPYDEFYLKSALEMAEIFGEGSSCLINTAVLAERIDTSDIEKNLFGGMRLPRFNVPDGYKDPYDYLCYLAKEGLKKWGWDKSKKHIEALNIELTDVKVALDNNNYDFATYFLIVRDYIKAAQSKGILVGCGRGSGYASVLLRCLDITYGVDPLEYELLWPRFLGFDSKRFIMEKDFGFEKDIVAANIELLEGSDVEDERELEEDLGGVDRY